MKIRRAIGFAVLAYVISMIMGAIVSMIAGLDMTTMSTPPLWLCAVSVAIAVLFCSLVSYLYFRGKHVKKGEKAGLHFGVILVLTGFVLDVFIWGVVFPGGTSMEGLQQLMKYYAMPYFRISFVLIILASTLTGKYMKHHNDQ